MNRITIKFPVELVSDTNFQCNISIQIRKEMTQFMNVKFIRFKMYNLKIRKLNLEHHMNTILFSFKNLWKSGSSLH